MSLVLQRDFGSSLVLSVNGDPSSVVEFAQPILPRPSMNVDLQASPGDSDDGDNTLWIRRVVPAGTRGLKRESVANFDAHELFGSAREVALLVPGLPFHGVGTTLSDAQEDLVSAIEETLDELEGDLRAGTELSPQLQHAIAVARRIFGVGAA